MRVASGACKLCDDVRHAADPQGRSREYLASQLEKLAGTRMSGFLFTRQAAAGKWGAATYAQTKTDGEHHRDRRGHKVVPSMPSATVYERTRNFAPPRPQKAIIQKAAGACQPVEVGRVVLAWEMVPANSSQTKGPPCTEARGQPSEDRRSRSAKSANGCGSAVLDRRRARALLIALALAALAQALDTAIGASTRGLSRCENSMFRSAHALQKVQRLSRAEDARRTVR
jgi:hypothetical protein